MGKKHIKEKRLMFIYNPEAGDPENSNQRLAETTRQLIDLGYRVRVVVVKPKELAGRAARKAVKMKYPLVVVMGGDGTIESAAYELVGSKTRLAILPGGTENNVARSLGIPEDTQAVCDLISAGTWQKIDVGQVKVKGKTARYFLEFAAVGLLAEIFPDAQKVYRQEWSALGQIVKDFIGFRPPEMKIRISGQDTLVKIAPLAIFSNTPQFGIRYRVAPSASLTDGKLDLVFFQDVGKTGTLRYLQSVLNGREGIDQKIQRCQVKKATLRAEPKQAVVADGVVIGKGKVKIRVLRGALRVYCGGMPKQGSDGEESGALTPAVTPGEKVKNKKDQATEPVTT